MRKKDLSIKSYDLLLYKNKGISKPFFREEAKIKQFED